jgi:hypothetical protein
VHLLAKLMVSSEEVAAAVISRQPSGELRQGGPELGLGAREGGRSGPLAGLRGCLNVSVGLTDFPPSCPLPPSALLQPP